MVGTAVTGSSKAGKAHHVHFLSDAAEATGLFLAGNVRVGECY